MGTGQAVAEQVGRDGLKRTQYRASETLQRWIQKLTFRDFILN